MQPGSRLGRAACASALLLFVLAPTGAPAQDDAAGGATSKDDAFYFLGVSVGRRLQGDFFLSSSELEQVVQGLKDASVGKTRSLDEQALAGQLAALAQERRVSAAEEEKKKAAPFVAEAAAAKGAIQTESGIVIQKLKEGSGASPSPTDTVKVHYHGTLRDGSVFDSSVERGTPAEFELNRVIPCWTEALQQMKVGGKSRIVCPADLAYGDRGAPPRIPGGAALEFEVELLDIVSR
jgi:FKBP-type peptidyl-prolyl cis-trans isomerase FkpA